MKFVAERARAARDLLGGVCGRATRPVADIGCGADNRAELLTACFDEAPILGFDTSEAMLAHAHERISTERLARRTLRSIRLAA